MSGMIKKFREHLNNDNKGMSLVTVIVAIGFVLILASAIMMTTTITFKMKNINVYSKDSFYSAEQVLDEINVGLQQLVSDGLSKAYTDVLMDYEGSEYTPSQKNEMVKAIFYKYIEDELSDGAGHYLVMPYVAPGAALYGKHSDALAAGVKEGLYGFLKASTRWHEMTGVDTAYGAFLRSSGNIENGAHYLGNMKETKDEGIILKDLLVYYRDSNGFVSEIKTDIRIVYPDFRFSDNDAPNIGDYCFITDTALVQDNKGGRGGSAYTTTIKGNSYAYKINTSGVNIDYKPTGKGTDTHIVADELDVVNGSLKTYDATELWVADIVAKSSNVSLAGYTYVQDDLDLRGNGCKVTMTGYYTGYGNKYDKANYSSAILVNGINTDLDFQYVKKLTLAGRAFVATSSNAEKAKEDARNADKATVNAATKIINGATGNNSINAVYTGESIAAKVNQLCYLVPGECIGIDENGDSVFHGANPIELDEQNAEYYEQIKAGTLEDVSINKKIKALGSLYTLGDFVATDASGKPEISKVFVRGSENTFVYYYMKFKDDAAANIYFAQYYGLNSNLVGNYLSQYIKAIKMPDEIKKPGTDGYIVSLKVDLAGNVFADDENEKRFIPGQIRNSVENDEGVRTISQAFEEDANLYNNQFIAYCTKLTPAIESLDGDIERDGDNKALFLNLVNEDILKEIANGSTRTYFKDSKDKERVLFIYAPLASDVVSLTAKDMSCNLIIANCGVKLESGTSFTGTILAKGKIEVPKSNFDFMANSKKVNECMSLKTEDGVYSVTDIFMDSEDVKFRSITSKDDKAIKVDELVKYENWTKNVEVGK